MRIKRVGLAEKNPRFGITAGLCIAGGADDLGSYRSCRKL
jgi:hypothetical protein